MVGVLFHKKKIFRERQTMFRFRNIITTTTKQQSYFNIHTVISNQKEKS